MATIGADRSKWGRFPPIDIPEARQFVRLYGLGCYLVAKVPASMVALNAALGSNGASDIGAALQNRAVFESTASADLQDPVTGVPRTGRQVLDPLLRQMADNFNSEVKVLEEVRRQFDMGTAPVSPVNAEFKTFMKEFVTLCANDLTGVDERVARVGAGWTPRQTQELHEFLKRLKRGLIRVTQSMSSAGTVGNFTLMDKWWGIVSEANLLLAYVGVHHMPPDDSDAKHVWSVLATLTKQSPSTVGPYVVHAYEGLLLLDDAITIYDAMQRAAKLADESLPYLTGLLHDPNVVFAGETVSARLRANASLVAENWIPTWQ